MPLPLEVLTDLGLPPDAVVAPAGGATGRLWKVSTPDGVFGLRIFSSPEASVGPLAAMDAARQAGFPIADVIRDVVSPIGQLVLHTWLPGVTVAEAVVRDPGSAERLGRLLGETNRELHGVRAPDRLAPVVDSSATPVEAARALPEGESLLHMDWHPLNVLVEEGRISGVLDWDNARGGHPLLDLARTHSLLTVDPALESLSVRERELLGELLDAWATGYGPEAVNPPAACLAWAGRFMLADLSGRYAANPSALHGVRRWVEEWERRT